MRGLNWSQFMTKSHPQGFLFFCEHDRPLDLDCWRCNIAKWQKIFPPPTQKAIDE